jgi:hypothetical protein
VISGIISIFKFNEANRELLVECSQKHAENFDQNYDDLFKHAISIDEKYFLDEDETCSTYISFADEVESILKVAANESKLI